MFCADAKVAIANIGSRSKNCLYCFILFIFTNTCYLLYKAACVIPTDAAGWIKIRVNWNPNRLQSYSFHLRPTRKRGEIKQNGCYSIFRLKMLIMNNVTKKYLRKKCQIVTPIWGQWPHKAAASGALGGRHRGQWKVNPYRLGHRRGQWMSGPTVRHLFQTESLYVLSHG